MTYVVEVPPRFELGNGGFADQLRTELDLNRRAQVTDKKADNEPSRVVGIDDRCPGGVRTWGQAGNRKGRPYRPPQTLRHASIIDGLKTNGASTSGFSAAVAKAAGVYGPDIQPDAYTVDAERRLVTIGEVEVTHPITPEKWQKIRAWRDVLAAAGWSMRLVAFGSDGGPAELDIDTGQLTEAELDRVRRTMETAPGFGLTP